MDLLLLVVAAFFAGVLNSVAGGGSFLTFPALIFAGVPPIAANATSTAAIFPATFASAWAYREDFAGIKQINLKAVVAVSVVGGAAGAILLLKTPEKTFSDLIPWLMLVATLLFTFGRHLTDFIGRFGRIGPGAVLVMQAVIAVYGGYFGGGIGILMLAMLGLFGLTDIHAMNGVKTLLSGCLNGVAVIAFAIAGKIYWTQALIMVLSATLGGWVGARVARQLNPAMVRRIVTVVGFALTAFFFAGG